MNETIAAIAAVAASITFGASDVIEQRATHTVPERRPTDIRLFVDMVGSRRPGNIPGRHQQRLTQAVDCRTCDLALGQVLDLLDGLTGPVRSAAHSAARLARWR